MTNPLSRIRIQLIDLTTMRSLFSFISLLLVVVFAYDLRELKASLAGSSTVFVTVAEATATVMLPVKPSVVITVQHPAVSVAVETAIVTETLRIKREAPPS